MDAGAEPVGGEAARAHNKREAGGCEIARPRASQSIGRESESRGGGAHSLVLEAERAVGGRLRGAGRGGVPGAEVVAAERVYLHPLLPRRRRRSGSRGHSLHLEPHELEVGLHHRSARKGREGKRGEAKRIGAREPAGEQKGGEEKAREGLRIWEASALLWPPPGPGCGWVQGKRAAGGGEGEGGWEQVKNTDRNRSV